MLIFIAVIVFNSIASPYFLNPTNLLDTTFSFVEKGLIALPMTLGHHHGGHRHFGCRHHRSLLPRHGSAVLDRRRHRGPRGRGPRHGSRRRLHERAAGHAIRHSDDRGDDRRDLALPRHRLRGAGRPGLHQVPRSFAFFGQGYIPGTHVPFELVVFVVFAVALRPSPASHHLRPPGLRHRQQCHRVPGSPACASSACGSSSPA